MGTGVHVYDGYENLEDPECDRICHNVDCDIERAGTECLPRSVLIVD